MTPFEAFVASFRISKIEAKQVRRWSRPLEPRIADDLLARGEPTELLLRKAKSLVLAVREIIKENVAPYMA